MSRAKGARRSSVQRCRITTWVAVLAVGLLGSAGGALAQDAGVSGELERSAGASPQEKLDYASDAAEEQRGALKEIQTLIDDATRQGEAERLDCLTERLSQIRALAQVTELAETSMRDSLAAGQTERADHEMRKIAVALGKTRQLMLEAKACVDEAGVASGETTVRVDGELAEGGDETSPLSVDVMDQGFDPPQQSPFN